MLLTQQFCRTLPFLQMGNESEEEKPKTSTTLVQQPWPNTSGQVAIIPCNLGNFNHSGNIAENWKQWYHKFKIYVVASNLDDGYNDRKIDLLLHNLGDKCFEIFNSFDLNGIEAKSYKVVINKFESHFSPRKNLTVLRHKSQSEASFYRTN